ncbi:MAG: transposase, partial [Planctomycetota bacterium]|nr:transposase [Planctomycetota bacterium]
MLSAVVGVLRRVSAGSPVLAAQLRPSDVGAMSGALELLQKIVTRIRPRWPHVRIIVRGDGHFSDDRLMSWCESTPRLEFTVGMPSNARLLKEVQEAQRQIAGEFAGAREADELDGRAAYEDGYCPRGDAENR